MPAIPTVNYFKHFRPWLQSAMLSTKNTLQAGKTWLGNARTKTFYKPVLLLFKPEALDEIFKNIVAKNQHFRRALYTLRLGKNPGVPLTPQLVKAPVTLEELQAIAKLAESDPRLNYLKDAVTNYIKDSGITYKELLGIGLTNQATKWSTLAHTLQPGHTLRFDPATRTLLAIDTATGLVVYRPSIKRIGGTVLGTGGVLGTGYLGYDNWDAISDMFGNDDRIKYLENLTSDVRLEDVSNKSTTDGTSTTGGTPTPQDTENLPPPDQEPTPPVNSTKSPDPAPVEVPATPTEVPAPAAPATTADTSFVDKALQWGKDNPDLASLLSLLAVGAGGVGLYSLLDDDEEEDEEEEY